MGSFLGGASSLGGGSLAGGSGMAPGNGNAALSGSPIPGTVINSMQDMMSGKGMGASGNAKDAASFAQSQDEEAQRQFEATRKMAREMGNGQ